MDKVRERALEHLGLLQAPGGTQSKSAPADDVKEPFVIHLAYLSMWAVQLRGAGKAKMPPEQS
eukprot:1270253-Rhodomonas_salina.1